VEIAEPDIKDYIVGFGWPIGGKIASLVVQAGLGSGFCSVKIGHTPVTGLAGVKIDQTRRTYNAGDLNIVNPGNDIIFSIDEGDESLINVNGTIAFQRTTP
jgi:hypothetical protein